MPRDDEAQLTVISSSSQRCWGGPEVRAARQAAPPPPQHQSKRLLLRSFSSSRRSDTINPLSLRHCKWVFPRCSPVIRFWEPQLKILILIFMHYVIGYVQLWPGNVSVNYSLSENTVFMPFNLPSERLPPQCSEQFVLLFAV